jgi:hypothetical protein
LPEAIVRAKCQTEYSRPKEGGVCSNAIDANVENRLERRPNPNLERMNRVREILGRRHGAYRTERTCCQSILRYIGYFGAQPVLIFSRQEMLKVFFLTFLLRF